MIRLLSELKRGRRYSVPFRVVVHQVTTWKIKEHFAPAKITEVELEDWLAVAAGEAPGIVEEAGFEAWLVGLTELEASVIRIRYDEGLELSEIAVRLDRTAERCAPDPLPRAREAAEGGRAPHERRRVELPVRRVRRPPRARRGPDVREYLARAGGEQDDLGRMIDRYLEARADAPARPRRRSC